MVDSQLESLTGVRQILAGGDVLSVERVGQALERLGARAIDQRRWPDREHHLQLLPPDRSCIGGRQLGADRESHHLRAYIVDKRGEPSPIGVVGEIYVGGKGLARGYVNNAGLTAERFVPDWLSGEAGGRLYRTGNLGRYRADGNIEFLGRGTSR